MIENERKQAIEDQLREVPEQDRVGFAFREARNILHANPDKARDYALYLLEYSEDEKVQCSSKMLMVEALFELGYYEESYQVCLECAKLNEIHGYPVPKGSINNWLGLALWRKGELEKALESLYSALRFFTEDGSKEQVANVENNIGLIYWELKMVDDALRHYQESLNIKTELNDAIGIATLNNNIAGIYYQKGDFATAIEFMDPVIQYFTEAGRFREHIQVSNNKSILLIRIEEYDQAEDILMKSYNTAIERNYRFEQVMCLTTLGDLASRQGKHDRAEEYFAKAIDIGKEVDSRELVRTALSHQAGFYEKIGEDRKALQSFKEMSQLKDELFHEQFGSKIAELETRFETEKKEKEKEIYRLKNLELAQKNAEIQQQKTEMEIAIERLKDAQEEIVELERKASAMAMAVTANHEINQPLMVIRGNLDLFRMSNSFDMSEKQKQYMLNIEQSIDRISRILKKFKDECPTGFTEYSASTEMVTFDEGEKSCH